jgi:hypothetical protein
VLCFSVRATTYSYFKTKATACLWLGHPDQEVDTFSPRALAPPKQIRKEFLMKEVILDAYADLHQQIVFIPVAYGA